MVKMVTPSYALNIAEELTRQGADPRQCSLSIGILGAEPWTEAMRRQLESTLGIDAVDIYGLSEAGASRGFACRCGRTW